VDEDIGVFEQCGQNRFIFFKLDIEIDALFISVEGSKYWSKITCGGGPGIAHGIARCITLAVLDLDNFGTQIGKLHGCKRPHHHARHIDDLDAFHRTRQFPIPFEFRPSCHVALLYPCISR
jgi:hypothetical protein